MNDIEGTPDEELSAATLFELALHYSDGLRLCAESAALNGDRRTEAYRHLRAELRKGMLLQMVGQGMHEIAAGRALDRVIDLANTGAFMPKLAAGKVN